MAALLIRQRRTRRWWQMGGALFAVALFGALFVASSGAVITTSPSGFESNDGNMALHGNTPAGNPLNGQADWNCFYGLTAATHNFQSGTPDAACSSALKTSEDPPDPLQKTDMAASTTDDSWVNGQKMDTACAQLANNKNQQKNDFTNVASYSETASNLKLYLYGATIRVAANGNASENVELNKLAGTSTCPINRSQGDKLLAFDYLNGGTSLDLHVLTWVTSSAGFTDPLTNQVYSGSCIVGNDTAPCWSATVVQPAASTFEGQVSQSGIAGSANAINGQTLVAGQFAEFGVNITDAIYGGVVGCQAFAQTTWESRSAGSSFSSNPEDISIEKTSVTNCGKVRIIKNTAPRGTNQWFSYTATGSGLSAFRLNDKTALSITAISATNPAVITTASAHGLTSGDMVTISGSNSSPAADGTWTATVIDATHFSIPLTVATAGTAGSVAFNTEEFTNVLPGSKTVTETVPAGWALSGLSCAPSNGAASRGTQDGTIAAQANVTVVAGSTVTCTYVNAPNSATLATSVDSGPYTPGTALHDTATVTGNVSSLNPAGNVTFYLCAFAIDSTAACDGTTNAGVSIGTGSLSGSGGVSTATSPSVNDSSQTGNRTTLGPGRYCFRAEWPGDTNYPGSKTEYSTSSECFTVSKIDTSTVTTPNDGSGPTGAKTTITYGSSIYDTAVVTDLAGIGNPDGSVTFYECGPIATGTCGTGGTEVGSQAVTLVSGANHTSSATSDAFTPGSAGRYCFRAEYGGSTTYNTSSDSRSTECFTVTDTTSGTSAQTWLPNDSATVAAAHGAPLNGTLTLQLYTGGTCAAGNEVSAIVYTKDLTDATTPVARTITSNNSTYTVSANATVSWKMTFAASSGSSAYVGDSSHCESTVLTVNN